jgi:hypothetical protein
VFEDHALNRPLAYHHNLEPLPAPWIRNRPCSAFTNPAERDLYGSLIIKRGLKRQARKRTLQIDGAMKAVLDSLLSVSECDSVFAHPGNPIQPPGAWVLQAQMGDREPGSTPTPTLDFMDCGTHF